LGRKVILDVDPGIDDAIAIILACNSPEIEILGVTTVAGNVSIEKATRNALRILEYVGCSHIPVYPGISKPIYGELHTIESIHGENGLGDVGLPDPNTSPRERHAVDFLREIVASEKPGEITLVATGPLTNVATALLLDPSIARRLSSIISMGGAFGTTFYGCGNQTPRAEFNVATDPVAAKLVYQSGAELYLFGLDVTMRPDVSIKGDLYRRLGSSGSRCGELVYRMLHRFIDMFGSATIHDPIALSYILRPHLFDFREAYVDVEICGDVTRGETVADLRDWLPPNLKKPPNAKICIDLKAKELLDFIFSRIILK